MVLEGKLNYVDDGLTVSLRGMATQLYVYGVHSNNIAYFGVPGFQRSEAVMTSFVETLGQRGVDTVVDTSAGRFRQSNKPLDFCITTPNAYFQKLSKSGSVELTRDGRMTVDKTGALHALDGQAILSSAGTPLKLSWVPDKLTDIKATNDGTLQLYDAKTQKMVSMGQIGVVQSNGSPLSNVDIKQGFVEDSNVMLQNEFVTLLPLRRSFEANRQMFIMQSDELSRVIQELGRSQ